MVIKYTPKNVIDELKNIRAEHNLKTDADAFKKMVEFSKIGREADKMMRFNFFDLTFKKKRKE